MTAKGAALRLAPPMGGAPPRLQSKGLLLKRLSWGALAMGTGCSTRSPFHGSVAAMGPNSAQMCPDMPAVRGHSHIRSQVRLPWAAPGPPGNRQAWDAECSEQVSRPVPKKGLAKTRRAERGPAAGASVQLKGAIGHG